MQFTKDREPYNATLSVAKDLPWKVFASLLTDLGINGPEYRELFGAVRNRNHEKLLDCLKAFEPRRMLESMKVPRKSDAFEFFRHYQLGAFLKKFPFKGQDTKTPAIESFKAAERQCSLFNSENYRALLKLNESHPQFLGIVEEIQDDVKLLLGELPPIDRIIGHAKHGPGVSLGDLYEKGRCTEYYKWSELPYAVTQGTLELARSTIQSDPRWIGALDDWYRKKFHMPIGSPINLNHFWSVVLKVVDGSRITTVPKTALTDRTIAIEPLLNCFFQLGVDRVIKSALRRKWGYDLSSQTRNQIYAKEASVTNKMVTVDLKAASDTIALMICAIFLPPAWYNLLLDLRSPKGDLEGEECTFEKISSMGNGYTFALESLIFGALVRCAIRRTQSERKSAVYGDDLIVPTTAFSYLRDLLVLCGFKLNDDKSFSDGPFRESCGKDFFLGYDVRPVFLKRTLETAQDLFYLHNSLFLLQERLHWTWGVDLSKTLELVVKSIPANHRKHFLGPVMETLDNHIFSHKKLSTAPLGEKFFWQIIAKPERFDRGSKFYFRKLMCQLRTSLASPFYWWRQTTDSSAMKWDKERRFDTGNAFTITRRDAVEFYCVKHYLVFSGSCDQKPLAASVLLKSRAA